ncbi:MaoC/PaaZ C-terminal domain-containing protein [Gordonia rubripertincta]|uniref:MaoC/PaaZ C-terminal domain-containing protein n=1 Tax=Gordonia rubripertincta TaxID=36822 RepID=A0ABT4MNQ3_GORRU|nr:MaoC/PaaZ C-terminal domain-containing protein [Gordonia rubripertincta]MCZ4548631.1 MaoC/PaaZ C-terminal domain-containing protein [Gordonia rubripertincta]
MDLSEWSNFDLGTRLVSYDEDDVMLYALAVGAQAGDLPLIFERDLRVLPTFALPLGLWVADAASAAGAFEPAAALHAEQGLRSFRALPGSGQFEVTGRISQVRDTGRSAILDITAESEFFAATYSVILPGQGGFSKGSAVAQKAPSEDRPVGTARAIGPVALSERAAVLYRLTGDKHLIHVDPKAARDAGFARPLLHGLCTLGTTALAIARDLTAAPWELSELEARFTAPVYPGQALSISSWATGGGSGRSTFGFDASVEDSDVLTRGRISFS